MQFEYDPELFIKEVEKRPGLWERNDKTYRCKTGRQKLWKEIVKEMSSEDTTLSKGETMELVYQLQKKWKGIRDSYNKYVMNPKKQARPYVYYHLLHFLNDTPGAEPPSKSTADEENDTNSSTSNENGMRFKVKHKSFINVGTSDNDEPWKGRTSAFVLSKKTRKKRKAKKIKSETSDDDDDDNVANDNEENLCYVPSPYPETSHNALVSQGDHNKSHYFEFASGDSDGDPDKMFLMSLLPHFKTIPQENRLDTQMDIMRVIRNAKMSKMVPQ